MNEGFVHKIIIIFITFLCVLQVQAAKLNTRCTKDSSTGLIEGTNVQTPYTIASVSKVFTTHWAIAELGPRFRFSTYVHITPVAQDMYDVHIEGSNFPYFDRTNYQLLVSELNKMNISQIHFLTYDEDLVYSSNMRINPKLAHGNAEQTTNDTMKELRQDTTTINKDIVPLSAKAFALEKIVIPKNLNIKISDIHYVAQADFKPTALTKVYEFKSIELYRILKELNRNSHNYASENIFRKLSRTQKYDLFIQKQLNVPLAEIILYNGSGYPVVSGNNKYYNEASCRAVVEIMSDLRQHMITGGLEFKDIVAVAGKDSQGDGDSTVTQIYGNDKTNGALIAKTGTVNNTIALAGLISTENKTTYFHTSYDVERSPADKEQAYTRIKNWIMNDLIGTDKKGDLNLYMPRTFLPFDSESLLTPVNPNHKLP